MSGYKLQRYSIYHIKDDCLNDPIKNGYIETRENNENGEWVKWEDVESLIKAYLSLNNIINDSELIKNEINKIHRKELNGY